MDQTVNIFKKATNYSFPNHFIFQYYNFIA